MTSSWFFLSTLNYDARSTTHQKMVCWRQYLHVGLKHVMTRNNQNLYLCSHHKIRLTWEWGQCLGEEKDCWGQGTVCSDTCWKTGLTGVGNNPVLLDPSIFRFSFLRIILQGSCFPIKQNQNKKKPSNNNHQILRGDKHQVRPIPQIERKHYMLPYLYKI